MAESGLMRLLVILCYPVASLAATSGRLQDRQEGTKRCPLSACHDSEGSAGVRQPPWHHADLQNSGTDVALSHCSQPCLHVFTATIQQHLG